MRVIDCSIIHRYKKGGRGYKLQYKSHVTTRLGEHANNNKKENLLNGKRRVSRIGERSVRSNVQDTIGEQRELSMSKFKYMFIGTSYISAIAFAPAVATGTATVARLVELNTSVVDISRNVGSRSDIGDRTPQRR